MRTKEELGGCKTQHIIRCLGICDLRWKFCFVVVVVVVETAHYGKENLLVVLKRSSQLMRKESGVVSYCVAVSGGWWNVSWNG